MKNWCLGLSTDVMSQKHRYFLPFILKVKCCLTRKTEMPNSICAFKNEIKVNMINYIFFKKN